MPPAASRRILSLEQPVGSVWQTLVDPQAGLWLTPKCVFSVAGPGPHNAAGSLRCCWADRFVRGVRRTTVWELVNADPDHVTYLDRSAPSRAQTIDLRLTAEGSATKVELAVSAPTRWWEPWRGRYLDHAAARLRAAATGTSPTQIDPAILVWAPGAGASTQVNAIVIAATPKAVWELVADRDGRLLARSDDETQWRTFIEGVEYVFDVLRGAKGELTCVVTKVSSDGPYRSTTVDSRYVEDVRELLPHEGDVLLRVTSRWNPPLKKKVVRRRVQAWLAAVKESAESTAT